MSSSPVGLASKSTEPVYEPLLSLPLSLFNDSILLTTMLTFPDFASEGIAIPSAL